MLIFLFGGPGFLPEYLISNNLRYSDALDTGAYSEHLQYKYSNARFLNAGIDGDKGNYDDVYTCDAANGEDETYCTIIASGRLYHVNGEDDYYPFFKDKTIYPRHVNHV
jgi:hypothetical protein